MAETLYYVRKEVRRHMRDERPGNFAVGTRTLNRIIESLAHDVDSELDAGQSWTNNAITLNPATDPPDYALPTSSEYQNVLDLRRHSDGYVLRRLTAAQIQQARSLGGSATASAVSAYALQQTVSSTLETITVLFDVRPVTADTIDILCSTSLAAFADSDDAVVPFQRDFMEAFQKGCAARGIGVMSPEARAARGFDNSPYVEGLEDAYQRGLKKERLRLIRLELSQPRVELERGNWG